MGIKMFGKFITRQNNEESFKIFSFVDQLPSIYHMGRSRPYYWNDEGMVVIFVKLKCSLKVTVPFPHNGVYLWENTRSIRWRKIGGFGEPPKWTVTTYDASGILTETEEYMWQPTGSQQNGGTT